LRFLLPLLLATIGAVAYGTFDVFSPAYGNRNAPIWLFWSYYNAIVIAVTIFTCIELPRPKTEGFRVDEPAQLTIGPLTRQHQVLLLSTSWAMLSGVAPISLGAGLVLRLQNVSEPVNARVSKIGKKSFEVTFETTPGLSRGDRPQAVFGPIPAQAGAISLCRCDHCNRGKTRLVTSFWEED